MILGTKYQVLSTKSWAIFLCFVIFIFVGISAQSQSFSVKVRLVESNGAALPGTLVYVEKTSIQGFTDSLGRFEFPVPSPGKYVLMVKKIGSEPIRFDFLFESGKSIDLNLKISSNGNTLGEVEVKDTDFSRNQGMIAIDPKTAKFLPSPFQDFNKLLATMPGVISNNELTSNYSVRGGNYDENMIYVNDMEVYRPFLIRQGQQEGLSFVNPDLAGSVNFSTGGWKAIYGDKLSSVLAVQYRKPKTFGGSASVGLLGYTLSLEMATKDQRVSAVAGFRDKNSKYLLNTLPTQGQYLPHFNDLQVYINANLGKKEDITKTTLELLNTYAWNTYLIKPSEQETNFGTAGQTFKLKVAFDGSEQLKYETYQGSAKLTHRFNKKHRAFFMVSYVNSFEREYNNVEAGYRLCELVQDFSTQYGNNKCSFVQDLGTYFSYARNSLSVKMFSSEYRSTYNVNTKVSFQWGLKYSNENIDDRFNEYNFRDSAQYVNITNYVNSNNNLSSSRLSSYVSSELKLSETSTLTLGVRAGWWSLNQQFLVSPTAQYVLKPKWKRDFLFRLTAGIYRQPPFYREMRDYSGNLNTNLKAQSAFSASASSDYGFQMWGRDFRFITELYYKYLWDVVPYDIDNVRIRYYGQNSATAFATGIDFRLAGEFIKSNESWISLGLMNTQEKINGDSRGYIPRPTNQMLTFGMFFQDHLPTAPTWRMFLNLQFGTGLPFGVPNDPQYRNAFTMPSYRRVDIGFSKAIFFDNSTFRIANRQPIQSIWLTLEVLNIFGINNTISYLWVKDVSGGQFAVPNTLSQRFFNLRAIVNF